MQRESVLFYRSFAEAIKEYPEEDQLKALWAIIDYGLDGNEYTGGGIAKAAYIMAKPQIDANNRRYQNSLKGGAPKGNQNARKQPKNNQKTTKKQPKDKDKVKDKVKDKDKTLLGQAIDSFVEHRKQIKAPMTERAYELMFGENGKLQKLSGGNEEMKIRILNQSIENGWKGIFPIKETRTAARFNNATERNYNMNDLELRLLQSN